MVIRGKFVANIRVLEAASTGISEAGAMIQQTAL
jgi:hypothetical protein